MPREYQNFNFFVIILGIEDGDLQVVRSKVRERFSFDLSLSLFSLRHVKLESFQIDIIPVYLSQH